MQTPTLLACDGCGQLAGPSHITRRLQRLEWFTRFRPLRIHALLLGGIAPQCDADFLYAPELPFQGEARAILDAVAIPLEGKSHEAVLAEFQKMGLALTHVLECPLEPGVSDSEARQLLEQHLPAAIARIRRSLRPKRILLFSPTLLPVAPKLHQTELGAQALPSSVGVFFSTGAPSTEELAAFRLAISGSNALAV
jgi:hypothetical protein